MSVNTFSFRKKTLGTIYFNTCSFFQYWMYSKVGEIRRDEACLDYSGQEVILYPCHGSKGNQYWDYDEETKLLRHGSSDKCLAINAAKSKLVMEPCNSEYNRQQWTLENYDSSKL